MSRCLLLLPVALLAISSGKVDAQSLADVARAEELRRQAVPKSAKVYTNDDLKPVPGPPPAPVPPPPGGAAPPQPEVPPVAAESTAAAPVADAVVKDQAYWSGRIGEARSQLERSRAFAQALQNRVDMLWTDFVNRDNPVERGVIERDRLTALKELERLKLEIEAQTKAIAEIEEEGRRAGVPPAWLRPA